MNHYKIKIIVIKYFQTRYYSDINNKKCEERGPASWPVQEHKNKPFPDTRHHPVTVYITTRDVRTLYLTLCISSDHTDPQTSVDNIPKSKHKNIMCQTHSVYRAFHNTHRAKADLLPQNPTKALIKKEKH